MCFSVLIKVSDELKKSEKLAVVPVSAVYHWYSMSSPESSPESSPTNKNHYIFDTMNTETEENKEKVSLYIPCIVCRLIRPFQRMHDVMPIISIQT